jgi:hypothetical protein
MVKSFLLLCSFSIIMDLNISLLTAWQYSTTLISWIGVG